MNSPNRSIPLVPENTLDPAAGLNDAIQVIDALLQTSPISMSLTAPPGTSSDGDLYIVASPATGAWAGHENDLARYVDDGNFWIFYTAGTQVNLVLNQADGGLYKFDQSGSPGVWTLAGGLGDAPSDGTLYGRRDADWDPVPGLLVENTDSPAVSVPDVLNLIFGEGFTVTEMTGGVALVEGGGGTAQAGKGLISDLVISSNTINIDHGLEGIADYDLELTANVNTVNHVNVEAGMANWFSMRIRQDGVGGRTFTPPASWRYGSGVAAYTVSSGASDVDFVQGVSYDDGATWMISYVKDFIP